METVKNVVAIVTPLLALLIAWQGLSTWNRQLTGTRDSELSKRILVAIYNIEMMINDIRSPFVQYTLPEGVVPHDEEANNKAWAKYYEAKFRRLDEKLADLHAAGVEAKAVWDRSFMDSLTPVWSVTNRLRLRWKENVRSRLDPNYQPIFDWEEMRPIIYGVQDDEHDEFGREMRNAIEGVDERVRHQVQPTSLLRRR